MKGIILVAGKGTRMYPMSSYVAKALLPVYDKPAICYSIDLMKSVGIREILIVCDEANKSSYKKLLRTKSKFYRDNYSEIKFSYKVQRRALGIPDALRLGKKFVGIDNVLLLLGDNIFSGNLDGARNAILDSSNSCGCIFIKEVPDPERFGVLKLHEDGTIESIIEKPKEFISNKAVVGLYVYPNIVFNYLNSLKMSYRGEYEITDLNNMLIKDDFLNSYNLGKDVNWHDIGTPDGLMEASISVANNKG